MQQPPERVLAQARRQPEKVADLLFGQRRDVCAGPRVPQAGDRIGLDPALLAPPAGRAAQGGQLAVDGSRVRRHRPLRDRGREPPGGVRGVEHG